MTTPKLSFGNYNNATTNGSQLGTTGFAANSLSLGQPIQVGAPAIADVTVQAPDTPQVDAQTGEANNFWSKDDFWSKDGGAGLILGGVKVLGNLWSSFQAHKMAKEKMAFAREQWDTNLENQTQTYNTSLEDRIRGRYATGTRSEDQLQGEIDQHSL